MPNWMMDVDKAHALLMIGTAGQEMTPSEAAEWRAAVSQTLLDVCVFLREGAEHGRGDAEADGGGG